jgi:hypothetical protein
MSLTSNNVPTNREKNMLEVGGYLFYLERTVTGTNTQYYKCNTTALDHLSYLKSISMCTHTYYEAS